MDVQRNAEERGGSGVFSLGRSMERPKENSRVGGDFPQPKKKWC